jgi:hypothetical protein
MGIQPGYAVSWQMQRIMAPGKAFRGLFIDPNDKRHEIGKTLGRKECLVM